MARVVPPVAMMVTPPGVLAALLGSLLAILQPPAPMFQPLAMERPRAAPMHPTVALHARGVAFPALAPALTTWLPTAPYARRETPSGGDAGRGRTGVPGGGLA